MNNKIQTRGRPKEFDETEALTAAMHYFWEHGYDNTSLDNLLISMGIKKSSFYATFKSKEEVFSRCLALYRDQNIHFLRTLKADIGPKQTILTLVELTVQELKDTDNVRGCLLVNSGKECYNKYVDLSKQVQIEFASIEALFTEFVTEAQELGEIISKKNADIIAGRYLNTLNGLISTIQAGATQARVDDIVEQLKEILE
jgi:TetR/AcrR family transcriptional repressor of nem operon